jgi:hypothetical protein
MAPELLWGTSTKEWAQADVDSENLTPIVTKKTDVYGFGMVALEVRRTPFIRLVDNCDMRLYSRCSESLVTIFLCAAGVHLHGLTQCHAVDPHQQDCVVLFRE